MRELSLTADVRNPDQALRDHLNGILLAITQNSQDGTRVVLRPPGQRPRPGAEPSVPQGPLLPQGGGGNAPLGRKAAPKGQGEWEIDPFGCYVFPPGFPLR
jgi:hypothetical protein